MSPLDACAACCSPRSPASGSSIWAFPVIWGLLTSFKTERDVLAYPPVWLFKPTLDNYREVIFGASSILPNLWSELRRLAWPRRC